MEITRERSSMFEVFVVVFKLRLAFSLIDGIPIRILFVQVAFSPTGQTCVIF